MSDVTRRNMIASLSLLSISTVATDRALAREGFSFAYTGIVTSQDLTNPNYKFKRIVLTGPQPVGMSFSADLVVSWKLAPGQSPQGNYTLTLDSFGFGRHTEDVQPIYIILSASGYSDFKFPTEPYEVFPHRNNPHTITGDIPPLFSNGGTPLDYYDLLSGARLEWSGVYDSN